MQEAQGSLDAGLPLLAGDFDLSIGATMGYAGSLVAELYGASFFASAMVSREPYQ